MHSLPRRQNLQISTCAPACLNPSWSSLGLLGDAEYTALAEEILGYNITKEQPMVNIPDTQRIWITVCNFSF